MAITRETIQQQRASNQVSSELQTQKPLSLLGSALQIYKSFHKPSVSPSQNPYYESYYQRLDSNRDKLYMYNSDNDNQDKWNNIASEPHPIQTTTSAETRNYYGDTIIANRTAKNGEANVNYYGDNTQRQSVAATVNTVSTDNKASPNSGVYIPNTTLRVNGIALDQPNYEFIKNQLVSKNEGGKREGVSPVDTPGGETRTIDKVYGKEPSSSTTENSPRMKNDDNTAKMTNDNVAKTTNKSDSTSTNESPTKTSTDNSTKTTNDGNTKTTRHEETNIIAPTDKNNKQKTKTKRKKNKTKTKSGKHDKNRNEEKKMTDHRDINKTISSPVNVNKTEGSNTSNTTEGNANRNSSKINSLSNTTKSDAQPNNNNKEIASTASTSLPSTSLTGYASNMVQNSSEGLQYQTLEEHRDNRTHQNHIDMMNVKSSHLGNSQTEIDIENITIATTKGVIVLPPNQSKTIDTPLQGIQANNVLHKAGLTATAESVKKQISTDREFRNSEVKNDTSKVNLEINKPQQVLQVSNNNLTNDVAAINHASMSSIETIATKPDPTLIHIEINRTPLSKDGKASVNEGGGGGKDLAAASIRHNIEINSEDASELLLSLLKIKKKKMKLLADEEEEEPGLEENGGNNVNRNILMSKKNNEDDNERDLVDPRITDLIKLREEREREIDHTIRKYFNDVNKLRSIDDITATTNDGDDFATIQTPVPVFSSRDLRLLRRMVENSRNKKRSRLMNRATTLWEKMLELTAERKHMNPGSHRVNGKGKSSFPLASLVYLSFFPREISKTRQGVIKNV